MEMDGQVILFDPVFSERPSPLSFIGPKRFHPVPVSITDLPPLDAVVISHDHYDHLDYDTIMALAPKTQAFYMPLGVGSHLAHWGIASEKINELDWWDERTVAGGPRLVACPARHFSGRLGFGDRTQWSSWAAIGSAHRVFYTGDTGFMPLFDEIGERFGPFDLTLVKVGAYGLTWPDIHLNPEEGIEVHRMVRGRIMLPIHWGTFNLSYHAWNEPFERVKQAAEKAGVTLAALQPGEPLEIK
jgi:L-ascorbate metabolism protein UlaG (beta-lactamase superfamily)